MYALISVHVCMFKKKKEGVGARWTQVSNVQITGHTVFELKYDFIRNKQTCTHGPDRVVTVTKEKFTWLTSLPNCEALHSDR